MKYARLASNGMSVSRLVCGCDRLGVQGPAHLDVAFARGINAFDTARLYRGSERVLGDWMKTHGLRDQLYLITKGGFPDRARHRLTPGDVREDIERSLQELQTDSVDLFLLHYDAPEMPARALVELLHDVRRSGQARAVGVSNIEIERARACHEAAIELGVQPFSAVSVQFGLPVPERAMWPWPGSVSIAGEAGRSAREWYRTHDTAVFAYSSLARGFFSESFWKRLSDPPPAQAPAFAGLHGDIQWLKAVFYSAENLERYRRARELAASRGVTAAQVALAYAATADSNVFIVAGWSSEHTCAENVAALDLDLTPAELRWLECARPEAHRFR